MPSFLRIQLKSKARVSDGSKDEGSAKRRLSLSWRDGTLLRRKGAKDVSGPTSSAAQNLTTRPAPAIRRPIPISQILPHELIEIIIDHLHDDKATLIACSLTCQAWFPTSRYHLFYAVTIIIDGRLGFTPFLEFLATTERVATYIQDLSLWGQKSKRYSRLDPIEGHPAVCHHILTIIVSKLPNLNYLKVRGLRFAHSWNLQASGSKLLGKLSGARLRNGMSTLPRCDTGYSALPERRTINTLSLWSSGSSTYSAADFLNILSMFSTVTILTTVAAYMNDFTSVSPAQVDEALSPAFRVIAFVSLWSSPTLTTILSRSSAVSSLTTLTVGCDTWEDVNAAGLLIRQVRSTLQYLTVDHACLISRVGQADAGRWAALNLTSCTKLISIRFEIRMDCTLTKNPTLYAQVCTSTYDLLAFIPPCVIDLMFRSILHSPSLDIAGFEKIFDWKKFDDILVTHKQLTSVNFHWAERPGPSIKTALVDVKETPLALEMRAPKLWERLSLAKLGKN